MPHPPESVRIPLMRISDKVAPGERVGEVPPGLSQISEVEITVSQDLPEHCYALEVPDISTEFEMPGKPLGIFGPVRNFKALNDIYNLGWVGSEPRVCKVVKDESLPESVRGGKTPTPSSRVNSRRKSFMTPTPLHIPESRVSPIPDSAHEMIYLKCINESESLKVVPRREVVWMHPLILVIGIPAE